MLLLALLSSNLFLLWQNTLLFGRIPYSIRILLCVNLFIKLLLDYIRAFWFLLEWIFFFSLIPWCLLILFCSIVNNDFLILFFTYLNKYIYSYRDFTYVFGSIHFKEENRPGFFLPSQGNHMMIDNIPRSKRLVWNLQRHIYRC